MSEGISKTVFAVGLVVAILASSLISTVVSMQWAVIQGPKGDTGDTGPQGPQGEQGPPCTFTIENMSGWLPAPAYDSGWTNMNGTPPPHLITHGLNSSNVLIYVYANANETQEIWWKYYSENEVLIYRQTSSLLYPFRVMIWKFAEP